MAHLYLALNRRNRERRVEVYATRRNDLDVVTGEEFRQKTRLTPSVYRELYRSIEHEIAPLSRANHAISANTRLQATLRFLAQGNMYSTNCDAYGMSKASMSIHVNRCVNAINTKVKFCATNE